MRANPYDLVVGKWIGLCLVACFQPVSAQHRVKIALWGDSRENLDQAVDHITSILLNEITDWDIQVHTGDFTHDGSDSAWQASLHYRGIDQLFVRGKMLMCTSNHDADKVADKAKNRAIYDKYTMGILPVNSDDSSTHFYSWDKANVHIVFCDAYFTDSAKMQIWLDQYLKTVPAGDWLIGVWHEPAYGDLSYKEAYLKTCLSWLNSLHQHDASFVLNGHAHCYIRTKPLLPDGTVDEKSGIVHIVNGCGGASWKDPQPASPKTAFTPSEKSFPCITFLTFEGKEVTVQTVDARPGTKVKVIDEWKWSKDRSVGQASVPTTNIS